MLQRLFKKTSMLRRANQTERLRRPAFLIHIVGRYFNKLGHACICELLETQQALHILVTITSAPSESASAMALAIKNIEERANRAGVALPARVFVTFRPQQEDHKKQSAAPAPLEAEHEITVAEIDFAEFQKLRKPIEA